MIGQLVNQGRMTTGLPKTKNYKECFSLIPPYHHTSSCPLCSLFLISHSFLIPELGEFIKKDTSG